MNPRQRTTTDWAAQKPLSIKKSSPALPITEVEGFLKSCNSQWLINSKGHIEGTLTCDTFQDALTLANAIGDIAEAINHHPELTVSWGRCKIETWTHVNEALTENDLILVAKIEKLFK